MHARNTHTGKQSTVRSARTAAYGVSHLPVAASSLTHLRSKHAACLQPLCAAVICIAGSGSRTAAYDADDRSNGLCALIALIALFTLFSMTCKQYLLHRITQWHRALGAPKYVQRGKIVLYIKYSAHVLAQVSEPFPLQCMNRVVHCSGWCPAFCFASVIAGASFKTCCLTLKMFKNCWWLGLHPRPLGGACSAPPDSLAGFKENKNQEVSGR